jgi:cytochrome c oxidase assembly protein subunit 15
VDLAGMSFLIHRSFTIVLVICQLAILYVLYRNKLAGSGLSVYANIMFALIVLEAVLGIIMAYFSIPPFAQPIHLLLAVAIFGLQFLMILIVNKPIPTIELKTKVIG